MRLPTAVLAYANEATRARDPQQVVDLLHYRVAQQVALNVLGVWRVPGRPYDWHEYYQSQLVFQHSSAPAKFWDEFWELVQKYGPSIMAQYAWQQNGPFTWTECMRATKPTGNNRWIFELLNRHHMRDGLYCPIGFWICAFWSPRLVHLTSSDRGALCYASSCAAFRLDEILRKRGAINQRSRLTVRELQVMRELSLGRRPVDIAKHMAVSLPTVKTFQARAQRKLGAKTPAHAVAEAIRGMLMR